MDLSAFKRTLVYERSAPVVAVRDDLAVVRGMDDVAERRQVQGALGCSVTLVAAIAAFAWVAATEGAVEAWVALGLTVAVAVVAELWVLSGRKVDVPNRRYELVDQLLVLLAHDLEPTAEVGLRLDLREAVEDAWLRLRVRLQDGTSLTVEARDLPPTGDALPSTFAVELRPEANRYHHLATLGRTADEVVHLPDGVELGLLEIDDQRLRLEVTTTGHWQATPPDPAAAPEGEAPEGAEVLALALLSLYHVLNLAGAVAAAKAG